MILSRALLVTAGVLAVAASASYAQDEARPVADGGIKVEGWSGRIDPAEARRGQVLENSLLASHGDALHVKTGPAVVYWKPENTATGDYTVKATFTELAYMSLNDHPHPYGIFVAGSDMGTEQQRYLYCAAYGNGGFIMRGFGPEPFQLNGRRAQPHDAVNKAAGQGEPVTQEIAVSVRGDQVECSINGTVVGTWPKSDVVGEGKLTSTDGVYGIRFGHNTEGTVADLTVTQH